MMHCVCAPYTLYTYGHTHKTHLSFILAAVPWEISSRVDSRFSHLHNQEDLSRTRRSDHLAGNLKQHCGCLPVLHRLKHQALPLCSHKRERERWWRSSGRDCHGWTTREGKECSSLLKKPARRNVQQKWHGTRHTAFSSRIHNTHTAHSPNRKQNAPVYKRTSADCC